jgi:hypothetical protein
MDLQKEQNKRNKKEHLLKTDKLGRGGGRRQCSSVMKELAWHM